VKQLFSGFIETQDVEGRAVIELRTQIGGPLVAHVAGPLLLSAAFYFNGGEKSPTPWWFYALFAGVGLLTLPVTLWRHYRSRVRITMDRQQSRLLVVNSGRETVFSMGELRGAMLERHASAGSVTMYRLIFAPHTGERVPATAWFCTYRKRDIDSAIEGVRKALAARPVLV